MRRDRGSAQFKKHPLQLMVGSSALAVFSVPVPVLRDVMNKPHAIDHLKMLEEAQRRICAALARAGA